MRWVHARAFQVAAAAACAAGVVAAGVTFSLTTTTERQPVPAPRASPAPAPEPVAAVIRRPLVSPFTGEPVRSLGPVLAVKIDNIVYARPQTGLTKADLIYVIPVEGGLTRFMAIFSSHFPPVIGPVRSARQSDFGILHQFRRPAFAFSGAQPELLPVVEHARIVDLYAGLVNGYFRSPSRPAPYNLFAYTHVLLSEAKGASKAHSIGYTFGPPPSGGRTVRSQTVTFPAASYTFRWSRSRHSWLVWIDGAPGMTTDGGQLAPATVVIQYVTVGTSPFREEGLRPPYAETVGSGAAIVLRGGKAYRARWSRPGRNAGTRFTTGSGQPMNFARGQVWVVLVGRNRASRANESQ
jgi:Protein of unknown function (DUF3048) N-terminal domain/Protein of unknown function (DUF3048) C-terminal domain